MSLQKRRALVVLLTNTRDEDQGDLLAAVSLLKRRHPQVIDEAAQHRGIQLRSVKATLEGDMDLQGMLGIDGDVRNGFSGITVRYDIDANATRDEVEDRVRKLLATLSASR